MNPDTCDCCSADEISPSVEAFEQTGEIMCADCYEASVERQVENFWGMNG